MEWSVSCVSAHRLSAARQHGCRRRLTRIGRGVDAFRRATTGAGVEREMASGIGRRWSWRRGLRGSRQRVPGQGSGGARVQSVHAKGPSWCIIRESFLPPAGVVSCFAPGLPGAPSVGSGAGAQSGHLLRAPPAMPPRGGDRPPRYRTADPPQTALHPPRAEQESQTMQELETAPGAPHGRHSAAPAGASLPLRYERGGATGGNETGAQKRTRTSTVLPPLGPEPSASTNFAIWAAARIIAAKADHRQ